MTENEIAELAAQYTNSVVEFDRLIRFARALLTEAPAQSAEPDMTPPLKDSQRSHATSFYMSLPHTMDSAEAVITKVAADAYVNGFQAGKHCAPPQPSPTAVVLDDDWDTEFHKAAMTYRAASIMQAPEAFENLKAVARIVAQPVEQTAEPFECTHYDAFTEAHKQVAGEVNALRETLGMKAIAPPVEQTRALTEDARDAERWRYCVEICHGLSDSRGEFACVELPMLEGDFCSTDAMFIATIDAAMTAARPASGETE